MKFTKKFGLTMIVFCLMMSLASCQDDGVKLTEEQFLNACADRDFELVEKALKKNKKLVNAKVSRSGNPVWRELFYSKKEGWEELLKIFILNGLDANANDSGFVILNELAGRGNKELVALLIKKGAKVNAKGRLDDTALMLAASAVRKNKYEDYKEIIELLIKNGADVNAKNESGWTALHNAAYRGKKEIAELLISEGADVNSVSGTETVLMTASQGKGNKETVEFLISKGADVNAKTNDGITALMCASGYIKKLMGASFAKDYILSNGIVKALIANGADVNAQDRNGWSALLFAAWNGELEIAKTLVENGAKLNIKDGDTSENAAIKYAKDNGHTEVAEYLTKALASSPASYTRITNWKEVKLKQKEYIGKKVSIYAEYVGLSSDGKELLLDLDGFATCKFDRKLVDKILTLRDCSYYTFYGTVKEGNWLDPIVLYVEMIE